MTHEPNVAPDHVASLFRLDGKVAVVTGGASGMGEAMAHGLAQSGATVVVADFDLDAAGRVVDSVADRDYALHAERVDVADRGSVEALVEAVVAQHGSIDVLVNSAGVAGRYPAEDFPEEEWDRIVGVNLKGSFLAAQAAGRRMIAQGTGGSIINMASIGASIAYPQATAYLQSKGGVLQLTRSLALEWFDHGIRVNALAPTIFETSMMAKGAKKTTETQDFIQRRQLLDRMGDPRDMAGPAIFLASEAATMVTGHCLQVDAGYLAV
ncbi:SDR family NAD(P)-dependent oxidoreductase [Patulibacter sp. S7RM1-6]